MLPSAFVSYTVRYAPNYVHTVLQGNQVFCCVWAPDQWVPPYMALVGLALAWSTFLIFELKVFTVSGVVGQVRAAVIVACLFLPVSY